MSFEKRPTPESISHKYRVLVRINQPAPGEVYQFIDYALFNDEGTLVDIFHHLKSSNPDLPDGVMSCSDYENGLSGLTSKSGIFFALLDDGYESDPFGVADYLAACAKTYSPERAEWNAAWMAVYPKLGK